jgi:hypothetical protein
MSDAHSSANSANRRCLIASLVVLGELSEARLVGRRLLQLVPTFRLAAFRERTPLPGDVRDRFAERLKLAGLPE